MQPSSTARGRGWIHRINLQSQGGRQGWVSRNRLNRRQRHPRPRACREERNPPGRTWEQRMLREHHSMNGLEGKAGKKTRQEGGERGKGMAERGTEQWKGS